MNYIDMIVTIMQSMLFVYFVNYCVEYKIASNIKIILCGALLYGGGYFIPSVLGNYSICIFITHIVAMLIIVLFFYKKPIQALVAYNLVYFVLLIWILLFGNILYGVIEEYFHVEHTDLLDIVIIYCSQLVLFLLIAKKIEKIKQIYKMLLAQNFTITYVIMVGFAPDFLLSFYSITYKGETPLLKYIIIIFTIIFLISNIVYFIKIKERANEIYKLNEKLKDKNNELKKIKNTYGMQMASLYELSNMEQYGDVVNLLKGIINVAANTNEEEQDKKEESLLVYATKHIQGAEINIVIKETADLKMLPISEMELYRIAVNIVNNAVKAMKNKGTLTISSYNAENDIIIEIENDGEKIPEENINKIFESGFTTKNDNDKNHGYGLSIVKEIIENHNGKIFVDSNDVRTKFTMIFPINYFKE